MKTPINVQTGEVTTVELTAQEIAEREAVVKGYDLYKIGSQVPKV